MYNEKEIKIIPWSFTEIRTKLCFDILDNKLHQSNDIRDIKID